MFSSSGALAACCVSPHNECLVNHNVLHLNTHKHTYTHKVHTVVEKDFTASLTYKLPPASTMMKISVGLCSDPGGLVFLSFHPSFFFPLFPFPVSALICSHLFHSLSLLQLSVHCFSTPITASLVAATINFEQKHHPIITFNFKSLQRCNYVRTMRDHSGANPLETHKPVMINFRAPLL